MKTVFLLFLIFVSFDSFSQHFKKQKILGHFKNLDNKNELHTIENDSWIIKTPTQVIKFEWEYLFTIQNQPNNQPNLFHEELKLQNKSDTILFDILNYWSDTLTFYNTTTKRPLKLILLDKLQR